jgi:hypothetical protein
MTEKLNFSKKSPSNKIFIQLIGLRANFREPIQKVTR